MARSDGASAGLGCVEHPAIDGTDDATVLDRPTVAEVRAEVRAVRIEKVELEAVVHPGSTSYLHERPPGCAVDRTVDGTTGRRISGVNYSSTS